MGAVGLGINRESPDFQIFAPVAFGFSAKVFVPKLFSPSPFAHTCVHGFEMQVLV